MPAVPFDGLVYYHSDPLCHQEGLSPPDFDKFIKAYSFSVGLAMPANEVGIDVACHVSKDFESNFGTR